MTDGVAKYGLTCAAPCLTDLGNPVILDHDRLAIRWIFPIGEQIADGGDFVDDVLVPLESFIGGHFPGIVRRKVVV